MSTRNSLLVLSMTLLVGYCSVANAESIGVKYGIYGDTIGAAEVAGVVPQANWNNASQGGQNPPATPINGLLNGSGSATTVNLTSWTQVTNNSWWLGDTASPNAKILNSFSDQQASITFAGVGTFAPNGYDVIVYYANNEGPTVSTLTLTGSVSDLVSRQIRTGNTAQCSYSSVGFVEETGAVQPPTSSTNYTVFSGLSDSGFNVAMTGGGNNGISAIQIVANEIPEPSSLILLGVAFVGLIAYAWRKRR